jgi:hypothetical protein
MSNTEKDKFTTIACDDDFRNDFAFRVTWSEILEPHGWVRLRSDTRGDLWEPPGRSGVHTPGAALSREYSSLAVFTTSTEFEPGRPYSKFDAYAVLNHGGDPRAAVEARYNQRLVVFRERDLDNNQIVRCDKYSYAWPADRDPLTVGDIVELPPPASGYGRKAYGGQPRQAKVTHLGTYYSGELEQVVRLVKRASLVAPETEAT